ncbi:MAG: hypothetical protein EBT57_09155, partial [Verrucomicrobia bacterium]|nr:hypothetical protein [Verrucomicrobiota bacterium]
TANIGNGGAFIDNNGKGIGINQTLTGTGGLSLWGSNWTTLRQNNTFSGDTVVNAGILQFYESGSLYNNGTAAGKIYVQNGAVLYFNRQDTFGNADTGSSSPVSIIVNGGVVNNGAVFNNLSNLTLNGGELRANGGSANGWNAYELNQVTIGGSRASTITSNTSGNSNNDILLSRAGTTTFNVASTGDATGDLLVSARLTDGNGVVGSLTKNGNGTMLLSGNNTYMGTTTVNSGTLEITGKISANRNGWLANAITVNEGATLKVNNWGWDGSLGTLYYDANAFVINGGTVIFTGTSSNGASARAFTVGAKGAVLNAATSGQTWNFQYSSTYPSAFNGNLEITGVGDGRVETPITGAGKLIKSGSGTWMLSGANSYTGGTTISGGQLQVGDGGGEGTIGTGNITNNGVLLFNRSNDFTNNFAISGTGEVKQIGKGTTTLTGNHTYTGPTTISDGVLFVKSGGSINSSTNTVKTGGVLWVNGAVGAVTVESGAKVKGSGTVASLRVNSNGLVKITATNTWDTAGPITLDSGS